MILGIDEVGRGPWAGPLVVGAVVLGGATIEGLTDSKKLSKKRREELDTVIRQQASGIGLGWVHADEIDEVGLSEALKRATIRAVEQITAPYHEIVIDGTVNFLKETNKAQFVTTLKKADLLVPSVSAASIVAKVARDAYMSEQDEIYPGYGFERHVGYGTALHAQAIDDHGVTPLHRLSFAPLKKYATPKAVAIAVPSSATLTTTKSSGDFAENVVAEYLTARGHAIIERNWKTKYCEIDIVSMNGDTMYFTEVKYRKNSNQGGGIAAITKHKHAQMIFAVKIYNQSHNISRHNLRLAVATVSGSDYAFEEWTAID